MGARTMTNAYRGAIQVDPWEKRPKRTAYEEEILARARRGETITAMDKIPMLYTSEHVDGFEFGLRWQGKLTPELVHALAERRREIEGLKSNKRGPRS